MASQADYKDRQFLAVIGDEDSVTSQTGYATASIPTPRPSPPSSRSPPKTTLMTPKRTAC
ncbi:Putative Vacuolar ATP synthase subunit F [Podospora comata]|uniref:Vacuolar ATP synthase subunit F n=1 Tax=Podospora comata TaxID=48703 RepID=A0ABY6S5S1_PODCO|nr:Putative Vacuolar ATP synthase subunit F [Podospora comata]